MSEPVEPESKRWPEWDRDALRTEMSLEASAKSVEIRVTLMEEVASLQADLSDGALIIRTIAVSPEISIPRKIAFFQTVKKVPGRGRGYGSMLIRALLAYARRNGIREIIGGVSAEELAQNRYVLEWYSKRGFIVERSASPQVPGSVATMRIMV